ncbi:MAG: nucleotide-binding universal stress UspA family protein [Bacteroidia bacterium]|jgi:nucleotide-binding universal stress UspA family protein
MTTPFPFKTIATAFAFSPYAEANLHESTRIAEMLNAKLVLIHVGNKTADKVQQLEVLIAQTEIAKENVKVDFREGDAVSAILDSCKAHNVDLLIAGAMKRENLLKFYTGSIARKLCRKANCSILLLTDRSVIRTKCNEIVVSGDNQEKTKTTVRTANYFGKILGANHITIVDEIDPRTTGDFADDDAQLEATAQKRKELKCKEEVRITKLEEHLSNDGALPVGHKCIFGKPGYTIGHYAAANKADLLVMNSPNAKLGLMDRFFPHDLEYVLSDLPCCLMIVHQKSESVA